MSERFAQSAHLCRHLDDYSVLAQTCLRTVSASSLYSANHTASRRIPDLRDSGWARAAPQKYKCDGLARHPVKQAVDYDTNGEYVRAWVPELRDVGKGNQTNGFQSNGDSKHSSTEDLMGVFQAWRLPSDEKKRLGLEGLDWVERPLVRINFSVNRRGGGSKRGRGDGSHGRANGNGGRWKGRGGRGKDHESQGRAARSGPMEKAGW